MTKLTNKIVSFIDIKYPPVPIPIHVAKYISPPFSAGALRCTHSSYIQIVDTVYNTYVCLLVKTFNVAIL